MTNYGLPLIFKMVNTKTGEELRPGRTATVANLKAAEPQVLMDQQLSIILKNLAGEWEPMQQTDFTDAAGKDVYFGDVIFMCGQSLLPDAFMIVSVNEWGEICATKKGVGSMPARIFSKHRIVGNCYEPPSRWIERAREIWPDAVLPEGVK